MSRKRIALVVVMNLLLLVITALWYRHATPLEIECQGNLTFKDQRVNNHFSYEGVVAMHFHPDGSGYFNLTGDVSDEHQRWEVSRQETFKWQYLHDTLYEITILNVERFGHDRVPAGLFEKYTAGITVGNKRLLTIERTPEDALVISNVSSPLLTCAR